MTIRRKLNIVYRHAPIRAEKQSRDPNKNRPEWFSYESCFENLITTIEADPQGKNVNITVIFDGTLAEFLDDFIVKYYAQYSDSISFQFVSGGSNGATFLIALDMMKKTCLDDKDIIYFLENDYIHQHGWVSKVYELFESSHSIDIVSLYDHRDKYEYSMYENLSSEIIFTPTHHWRTTPSTCGSFLIEKQEMLKDFDLWTSNIIDYELFPILQNTRSRKLVTPIPGLSTHSMSGYLSPTVDWEKLSRNKD
jgi:hypothetical protein